MNGIDRAARVHMPRSVRGRIFYSNRAGRNPTLQSLTESIHRHRKSHSRAVRLSQDKPDFAGLIAQSGHALANGERNRRLRILGWFFPHFDIWGIGFDLFDSPSSGLDLL